MQVLCFWNKQTLEDVNLALHDPTQSIVFAEAGLPALE